MKAERWRAVKAALAGVPETGAPAAVKRQRQAMEGPAAP
jgi:hypothetical protein